MMNPETVMYLQTKYGTEAYRLTALISCALILESVAEREKDLPPEIELVADTLKDLRESLSVEEVTRVAMVMADINGDAADAG